MCVVTTLSMLPPVSIPTVHSQLLSLPPLSPSSGTLIALPVPSSLFSCQLAVSHRSLPPSLRPSASLARSEELSLHCCCVCSPAIPTVMVMACLRRTPFSPASSPASSPAAAPPACLPGCSSDACVWVGSLLLLALAPAEQRGGVRVGGRTVAKKQSMRSLRINRGCK